MKLMNVAKRYGKPAVLASVMLGTTAVASAAGFDPDAIGQQVASVVTGFIALVAAIGMATITVVMAVQGYKLAASLIKGVK